MGFNSNFSFLGIGIPELVFIIMLALVVLGPERLPSVAKDLIRAFFKVRNLSKDLTGQLEAELGVAEIKELKGIKTGKLIEDWANDELNLDFDEDDEDRKEASQSKPKTDAPKQNTTASKSTTKAALPEPVKKPEESNLEETGNGIKAEQKEAATVSASPNGNGGVQKVESQNVIGSAHTIGKHPGSPSPELDMNGAASVDTDASASPADYDVSFDSLSVGKESVGCPQKNVNGAFFSTPRKGTGWGRSVPRCKDKWRDTMERRKQLRIQNHGRSKRIDGMGQHLGIQRSRLRKQSPAVRARAR